MNWTIVLTAASIVGTVANIRRRRWCFLIWVFTNAGWSLHDLVIREYPQAALFTVYLVLAIWGLIAWRTENSK